MLTIGVGAEPFANLAVPVAHGHDARQERAEHTIGAPEGKSHVKRFSGRD
jgi:hypothetical protein